MTTNTFKMNHIRSFIQNNLADTGIRSKRSALGDEKAALKAPAQPATFDVGSIEKFVIENNYVAFKFRLRLEDARDESMILRHGEKITFDMGYFNGKLACFHNNKIVQQLDLNNGGSSDDLNLSNTAYNRDASFTYKANRKAAKEKVVEFAVDDATGKKTAKHAGKFYDSDGIDGNGAAEFTLSVTNDTLFMRIDKMAIADALLI